MLFQVVVLLAVCYYAVTNFNLGSDSQTAIPHALNAIN